MINKTLWIVLIVLSISFGVIYYYQDIKITELKRESYELSLQVEARQMLYNEINLKYDSLLTVNSNLDSLKNEVKYVYIKQETKREEITEVLDTGDIAGVIDLYYKYRPGYLYRRFLKRKSSEN